jgi:hypothetical protein
MNSGISKSSPPCVFSSSLVSVEYLPLDPELDVAEVRIVHKLGVNPRPALQVSRTVRES